MSLSSWNAGFQFKGMHKRQGSEGRWSRIWSFSRQRKGRTRGGLRSLPPEWSFAWGP